MPLTLKHQTQAEFLTRFREAYRVSTGMETCRLARWLIDQLNAGTVTVAECKAAWGGINTAAWNSINGTMDVYAAAYTSMTTAVGE